MNPGLWLFLPIGLLAVAVRVVDSVEVKAVLVGVQLSLVAAQVYFLLREIRGRR